MSYKEKISGVKRIKLEKVLISNCFEKSRNLLQILSSCRFPLMTRQTF